ncbi:hypothetical protein SODALDRAFT_71270 [Sodiomyces alkalinus F11]|uniref:Uncharacterized protein n=1 Tax=Sodiomyces alkalinus (strain CBS 110278 / VKM F-3762 / F11) TaxID=1314773 RepID=A0A3N2PM73_SODAK|nr:hypothetical protein SODALDRAFT_71270 [Sodiomyces alkalinus F11]ROT35632.1 hypothetical protein SODALDRAFT_71270 [Sodiomyces alkalinus F11]
MTHCSHVCPPFVPFVLSSIFALILLLSSLLLQLIAFAGRLAFLEQHATSPTRKVTGMCTLGCGKHLGASPWESQPSISLCGCECTDTTPRTLVGASGRIRIRMRILDEELHVYFLQERARKTKILPPSIPLPITQLPRGKKERKKSRDKKGKSGPEN